MCTVCDTTPVSVLVTETPGSRVCGGGDISAAGVTTQSPEQALFVSDRILAQINKMRLRADFCDVRLLLGGWVFSVHKLDLLFCSVLWMDERGGQGGGPDPGGGGTDV